MCLAISMIVTSFRSSLKSKTEIAVLKDIFLTIMYNFVISIYAGLQAMFSRMLFDYLKKNSKRNEEHWGIHRINTIGLYSNTLGW